MGNVSTLSCPQDSDIYDLLDEATEARDEGASCLLLDIRGLTPEAITALLKDGQDMFKLPLAFKAKTCAQANAALRAYHGISALYCDENAREIAALYGAHLLV
jgi:hypothetical protein